MGPLFTGRSLYAVLLGTIALVGSLSVGSGCRRDEPDALVLELGGRVLTIEVAADEYRRERGYQGRTSIADDEALLVVFPTPTRRPFWSKNCLVPIDVAFIGDDFVIDAIHTMRPEPAELANSERRRHAPPEPVRFVLEARGGWFSDHGVGVGSKVDLESLLDRIRVYCFSGLQFAAAVRRYIERSSESGGEMGHKGIIGIFMVGAMGLIAFGVMAKVALEESPQAQALVSFQGELREQYGIVDPSLVKKERSWELVVEAKRPPESGAITAIVRGFRRAFPQHDVPATLDVVTQAPGAGCAGRQEIDRVTFDFEATRRAEAARVSRLVGYAVELEPVRLDRLDVRPERSLGRTESEKLAEEVRSLWGGGWRAIDVSSGKRRFTFREEQIAKLGAAER